MSYEIKIDISLPITNIDKAKRVIKNNLCGKNILVYKDAVCYETKVSYDSNLEKLQEETITTLIKEGVVNLKILNELVKASEFWSYVFPTEVEEISSLTAGDLQIVLDQLEPKQKSGQGGQ